MQILEKDIKRTEEILKIIIESMQIIDKHKKSNNNYYNQDNELPRYTNNELCEIMGVSEDWANNRKKAMLRARKQEFYNYKEKLLNLLVFKETVKIEKLLLLDILENYENIILKLEKELCWRKRNKKERNAIDIKQIKENITIAQVLGVAEPQKERQMVRCPFHKDNTPSFCIYKSENTFYCFSCGKGGDVITLYMLLNDCDFYTAIKILND